MECPTIWECLINHSNNNLEMSMINNNSINKEEIIKIIIEELI